MSNSAEKKIKIFFREIFQGDSSGVQRCFQSFFRDFLGDGVWNSLDRGFIDNRRPPWISCGQHIDYDIDVAVVFNKIDLGDKGPFATRNTFADALRRKTKQFNAEPEVKTSCVRIKDAEGYHVDFAVYRRYLSNGEWKYEHAGSEWEERDLSGIVEWFKTQNTASGGDLRKVVRLSKMFCSSRDTWVNMPSGLLQTVLCNENLQNYSRIDELFYNTMTRIVERLESDTSVAAPVDNGRALTPRKSDIQKMTNWKNRLKSKLEDLEVASFISTDKKAKSFDFFDITDGDSRYSGGACITRGKR